jgi:hypothetical protein
LSSTEAEQLQAGCAHFGFIDFSPFQEARSQMPLAPGGAAKHQGVIIFGAGPNAADFARSHVYMLRPN